MRLLEKYGLLVLLFFCLLTTQAQVVQDEVKAKIEVQTIEGNLELTGTAENKTQITKSASYKLSIIKNNKSSKNQSNNSQEGLFTLQPLEKKKLSTSQINLSENDEVIVLLLFYDENQQIISKDRLVFGGDENEKKKRI
ncbi:curli-like amyloid fiber formation chaperone CsgH [Flavobacterium agrisoli]|uniref:Curli production assembly/transport component CsgE n=1 Tax=Flavobacterium agrisoli TaxID=2793066 RepID=A0A934PKA9_9FLAO|nr:curli-like amyloid fiber formation chaperone CsgH [Flavobacterium agrisoli]MBK0369172.1 hypothetical protein [Flavobacterium agrisoli]